MIFDGYEKYGNAQVRESLLWEYDLNGFDWTAMRNVVVQRVVERGFMEDFYAILNRYGVEGVKESITQIPYLNAKDLNFVCVTFGLKKEELRCCTHRQSIPRHWNS